MRYGTALRETRGGIISEFAEGEATHEGVRMRMMILLAILSAAFFPSNMQAQGASTLPLGIQPNIFTRAIARADTATKPSPAARRRHQVVAFTLSGVVIGAIAGAAAESGHHTNCGQEISCRAGIPAMAAAGGVAGGLVGFILGELLPVRKD